MKFESKEEYEEYIEKAQAELNNWATNNPLPGIGIGRDEYGNVVHITTGSRMEGLANLSESNPEIVHSVEKSRVEERPDFKPIESKDSGCKTCGAKGLKKLIMGGAKLLKSELGIDAADAETVQNRMNICLGCEKYNFGVCEDCGCFTAAKVKLSSEKCPIGKW